MCSCTLVLAQRHHLLAACRPTLNSPRVALLTPASVACAESTTATSSVKGLTYSSSPLGSGLAAARRAEDLGDSRRREPRPSRRARAWTGRGWAPVGRLLGIGASRGLDRVGRIAVMTEKREQTQAAPGAFRAVLTPHRSLGPTGFLVLMAALARHQLCRPGSCSCSLGAWPVIGLLRAGCGARLRRLQAQLSLGRLYETVELTPGAAHWTRVHPSGRREQFDCNPYWARVNLREWPDGRTDLRIVVAGQGVGVRPLPHRRRAPRLRRTR